VLYFGPGTKISWFYFYASIDRLTDAKYQRAIAGLVHAMKGPWLLDMREHNFKEVDSVSRAIHTNSSQLRLNSLSLKNDESANLKRTLQHNRYVHWTNSAVSYSESHKNYAKHCNCLWFLLHLPEPIEFPNVCRPTGCFAVAASRFKKYTLDVRPCWSPCTSANCLMY
jgi:hypothetical protein